MTTTISKIMIASHALKEIITLPIEITDVIKSFLFFEKTKGEQIKKNKKVLAIITNAFYANSDCLLLSNSVFWSLKIKTKTEDVYFSGSTCNSCGNFTHPRHVQLSSCGCPPVFI